jgi:hypothetical protein
MSAHRLRLTTGVAKILSEPLIEIQYRKHLISLRQTYAVRSSPESFGP